MADSQTRGATHQLLDERAKVPNLAAGSSQLLMELMDGDRGVRDVLAALEQFAVVVARVIALANSAWSKPTAEVTTLDSACARLGLDVVRTLAVALVVGRSFNASNCPGFDRKHYWASSIVTSDAAATLAPRFHVDAPTARAAGLLHNIGLLWLADCLPAETATALSLTKDDPAIGLGRQLERVCGIGYRAAGVRLLTQWQLPEILIAGLRVPRDSDELELHRRMHAVVTASARIGSAVCAEQEDPTRDTNLQQDPVIRSVFEEQQSKLPKTLDMANALFKT